MEASATGAEVISEAVSYTHLIGVSENGGVALAGIAEHYFGTAGALILAATVTLACLKTAVGLITSCGETFEKMVPKGPSYKVWAVGFCVI